MSLFSSLIVFHPGPPPRMKLLDVRRFCDRLRSILSLGDTLLAANIKYGKAIDQDHETTNEIAWDESGVLGQLVSYAWDHGKTGPSWPDLWPTSGFDSRSLYRAYVGLGSLPHLVSKELTAMRDASTTREFIAPDSFSFEIDPVCPATLGTQELIAYGFIELSFSGNGFFSWQPLSRYWEQVRTSPALSDVLRLCRESFPAPRLDNFEEVENSLGELFLNREDYVQGDWIVSVSETG